MIQPTFVPAVFYRDPLAALKWLEGKPFVDRVVHLFARMAFRGIYFPQMKRTEWLRVLFENRSPLLHMFSDGIKKKFKTRPEESLPPPRLAAGLTTPPSHGTAHTGQASTQA